MRGPSGRRDSGYADLKMTAHYRWPDHEMSPTSRPSHGMEFSRAAVAGSAPQDALRAPQRAVRIGDSLRLPPRDDAAQRVPHGLYRRFGKRAFDIAMVVLSMPVTLPLVALLALANALSGNPPFYSQPRLGMNGRVFRMWKLRSMVVDADRKLAQVLAANPALRHEWETTQKLRNDPRITLLGRYMRMTSMDELPQLWNVLVGEMSLVGPRPMLPEQRPMYPGEAYFRLRPGLTGTWQVSERNGTCFSARARYDTGYEAEVTLARDLGLICATFGAITRGTGL